MPLEKLNLYKLKILDSNENKTTFSKLFGPLAEAIQTGSNPCVFGPKPSIENYLVFSDMLEGLEKQIKKSRAEDTKFTFLVNL